MYWTKKEIINKVEFFIQIIDKRYQSISLQFLIHISSLFALIVFLIGLGNWIDYTFQNIIYLLLTFPIFYLLFKSVSFNREIDEDDVDDDEFTEWNSPYYKYRRYLMLLFFVFSIFILIINMIFIKVNIWFIIVIWMNIIYIIIYLFINIIANLVINRYGGLSPIIKPLRDITRKSKDNIRKYPVEMQRRAKLIKWLILYIPSIINIIFSSLLLIFFLYYIDSVYNNHIKFLLLMVISSGIAYSLYSVSETLFLKLEYHHYLIKLYKIRQDIQDNKIKDMKRSLTYIIKKMNYIILR